MIVDENFSSSGSPAAERGVAANIDTLVEALRYPRIMFGSCAEPGLVALYEQGDWQIARESIVDILARHQMSTELPLRMLKAAGDFMRTHALQLCGNPWLSTIRFDDLASISYCIHLELDWDEPGVWSERLLEMLDNRRLLNDGFHVRLSGRAPVHRRHEI